MNIIKIKEISIFTFDLPLKNGFILKNTFIDSRKGILVEFETMRGAKYYGESSPLIYFHKEDYSDCLKQISEIKKIMLDNPDDFHIKSFEEKKYDMEDFEVFFTRNFLEKIKLYNPFGQLKNILSSVRYCFEMIYFCIFIKNLNFIEYFKISAGSFIPICRLVPDINLIDYGVLEKEIKSNKYHTIKIKIGRQKLSSEISAISKIINIIEKNNRADIVIRLDSNMSIPEAEIIRFLENIDKSHIDFIEDPVKDTSFYQELYEKTGVNIAADETIKDFIDFKRMTLKKNACRFLKVIIIKPQVIGGFIDSLRLIKMAKALKIKTVISNVFETSLSVSAICVFMYLTDIERTAAGLDTLDSFLQDPGVFKIKSVNGKISVRNAYNNLYKADYSVLEKLT